MTNLEITKLDWDSEFWSVNIYNAKKRGDVINLEYNWDREFRNAPFIIQALSLDSDTQYINALEDKGFRFVESKINLIKTLQGQKNEPKLNCFQIVREKDLVRHKDDFYELYGDLSRYSCFENEKINKFYYKWVCKSINGKLDDKCIGFYDDNILKGFITFKTIDKSLNIGLVGVFQEYQGQRISQKLLNYVSYEATANHCNVIRISTQGKNIRAINAYIKNGFIVENIQHWYYYKGGFK